MFLEPPVGARLDKRTLCFRIGNLCSDAALVGRDAANEVGGHCCYPLPTQRSDLQGTSRTSDLLTPTIFLFFHFWEPDIKDQDIQKQLHIQEKNGTCLRKGSEKTQKDIKFTPQAELTIKQQQTKANTETQQTLILTSRVITSLYSNAC